MMEHPIEGLMTTAMESIKEMVDVNTIVGDAVQSPDGTVIIPISRVAFGFAAGGGEYQKACKSNDEDQQDESRGSSQRFPFAGGSGAGVSINPVAFMVVGNGQMKLMPVNMNSSVDKILDYLPDVLSKMEDSIKRRVVVKKEIKHGDSQGRAIKEAESD